MLALIIVYWPTLLCVDVDLAHWLVVEGSARVPANLRDLSGCLLVLAVVSAYSTGWDVGLKAGCTLVVMSLVVLASSEKKKKLVNNILLVECLPNA